MGGYARAPLEGGPRFSTAGWRGTGTPAQRLGRNPRRRSPFPAHRCRRRCCGSSHNYGCDQTVSPSERRTSVRATHRNSRGGRGTIRVPSRSADPFRKLAAYAKHRCDAGKSGVVFRMGRSCSRASGHGRGFCVRTLAPTDGLAFGYAALSPGRLSVGASRKIHKVAGKVG